MAVVSRKAARFVGPLLLPATLAVALAACSDSSETKAAAPTSTQTRSAPAGAVEQAWEPVVPGGECRCADGSEFRFWVREENPKKVVFYLQDGGACFSAETCAPERKLYNTEITEGPTAEGGIFDFADERNPLADYSVVYVPYCTGDVFLGNTATEYAPGFTVQHKGYVNGTAALEHLVATFPSASDVVVAGESAGLAAPLYAGLVSDRLPNAGITVLTDGSGSYPDVPRANEIIAGWGTANSLPRWSENPGGTAHRWSFPGLTIQSGRRDPEIVFARHDYAYDARQAGWYPRAGIPTGDLLARIDANETQIERAGVNLFSYTAPGNDHIALSDERFYTETVNGEKLVNWVTMLIDGKPVYDVHCTECNGG